MYLTRLQLADFRTYESLDISLDAGVSVFLGPNGYGKTNLVEAVHCLATLGSHRVSSDAPLIRTGCSSATVAARVQAGIGDNRSLSVALELRAGSANQALLNQARVRPRELLGAVRTVLFAPEDIAIVRGDPSERRMFLDELVVMRTPRLAGVKSDYERVVKQKTAVLKSLSGKGSRPAGGGADQTLDVWDAELVRLGAQLVAARIRTVSDLAPLVSGQYDAIAPVGSRAETTYRSSSLPEDVEPDPAVIGEVLSAAVARRREEEIARGVCLVGPHRDDVTLMLGDLPVRGYASHGEGWSYALALRLASVDVLRADGVEPVLILDDVFAELDAQRRTRVVEAMNGVEQALVTAAVAADVPENLSAKVFEIKERGTVCCTSAAGVR